MYLIEKIFAPKDYISRDDLFIAVGNITESISSQSSEHVILFSALLGAFSAFIFNLVYWFLTRRANKKDSLIKRAIYLIDELEQELIEYWAETSGRNYKLEIRINAKFVLLLKIFDIIKIYSFCKRNKSAMFYMINTIDVLYDMATGGEFETSNRCRNPTIARDCASYMSDLKSKLFLL